jgi:general nucleoside transport system permease protein
MISGRFPAGRLSWARRSRLAAGTGRFAGVALASAVVGSVIVLLGGGSPAGVFDGLIQGSVGNTPALVSSLSQATPLVFAGLSFAVAFRAGVFNAGGQGQFLMGAFATAIVGFEPVFAGLPAPVHLLLVLMAGAIAGALWAAPAILLRIWRGTDEILTSLMLSYVAANLNDWLVLDEFRAKTIQAGTNAQTAVLSPSASFPTLVPGSSLTFMAIVAVAACVVATVYFRYSTAGFETRLVGANPRFAVASGVSSARKMIMAMLASGAIAGLGGSAVVGGFFHADITPFNTNVGFNGILASLLVGNVPLLIPLSSVFFGALQQGGLGLQILSGQSQYIADTLTAVIIIFVALRHQPQRLRALWSRASASRQAHWPSRPGTPTSATPLAGARTDPSRATQAHK